MIRTHAIDRHPQPEAISEGVRVTVLVAAKETSIMDETDNEAGLDLHSVNKQMDIATEVQAQEEMDGIRANQNETMTPYVVGILVMYQIFRSI